MSSDLSQGQDCVHSSKDLLYRGVLNRIRAQNGDVNSETVGLFVCAIVNITGLQGVKSGYASRTGGEVHSQTYMTSIETPIQIRSQPGSRGKYFCRKGYEKLETGRGGCNRV